MPDEARKWLKWHDEHCEPGSMAPAHLRRLLAENEKLREELELRQKWNDGVSSLNFKYARMLAKMRAVPMPKGRME